MSEQENIQVDEHEAIAEASDAQSSLKPNGKASKSELLANMLRVIGGMKKDDLSAFLDKTLAQVGKESDTVPDTSTRNASSIAAKTAGAPKPDAASPYASVKEDMEDLLGDNEDLSEDFKLRASTLFEAAVSNRVTVEVARIEEEFESKLEEQVLESVEKLNEQVDSYIDYVAQKWLEENAVAIETNYRSEITENFIAGLKRLFEENYVEVPEEKVDLLGELEAKVAQLEESLESVSAENVRLNKAIQEDNVQDTFEDVAEGLADTQVEKFRSLAESVEFNDVGEYRKKLEIIKEQYFTESASESKASTGLIDEEQTVGSNDIQESADVIPAEMRHYVQAISKTIKR
jgi:hypothetical protein